MRRLMYVTLLSCAAIAIASGVAIAAQTPYGNLGPPTSVSTGTFPGELLVESTAACPGFAPGDTLTFAITARYVQRFWRDSPLGVSATAEIDYITGSAAAGGWTYSLQGHLNSGISFAEDFSSSGKATITRSDGARISGGARVFLASDVIPGIWLLIWAETPRCN
jgi:hypothetical protein